MMVTMLSIENGAARTEDRRGYFRNGAACTEDRDRDGADARADRQRDDHRRDYDRRSIDHRRGPSMVWYHDVWESDGRPACDGYQPFSQAESSRLQRSYKPESSEFQTVQDALLRWELLFSHKTERASSQAESRGRKKIRKGTVSCEFETMS